ncbi:MAG TPA: pyridoxamine 5'-phosphate oxidase, partial [Bacteroidales bacterium]|nr:pyridoxamine 5'-phosphate oxidase [Bacteroidales bacterium]
FTNYNSKKSSQIRANNNVALLFYWPEKGRQVRIEGTMVKVSPEISDEYFKTRSRDSQLSAWASDQSSEVPGRDYLEERFNFFNRKFAGSYVPRPAHWGGYKVIPDLFEFWVNRENRLHDRIEYLKEGDKWSIRRLAP